ncbi:hypothetical protein AD998_21855 [bacterium 336/3]|nr:hypothetical protein AD998_21855 [bacterium 336/3]
MFLGCKPRTQELTPQKTAINPDLIEQAKTYFENVQSVALTKTVEVSLGARGNRVNLWAYAPFRIFTPIWNKTEQVNLSNGKRVLITPLYRNMTIRYANELYYIRRLRVELNAQNEIVKANIVELVTLAGSVAQNKNMIIANVFEEIQTRTDAKIMVFDAGYTPQIENGSWKGRGNNNANNRGSSNSSDSPGCYQLIAVVGCSDIQYIQDVAPCSADMPGAFQGFGTPINNCPNGGGSSWTPPDPSNPPPGGGGSNGDNGQEQPFIPTILDYNGVNIEINYKNAQGDTVAVDSTILKAYKFVIDDVNFRDVIKGYLSPNTDKLKITFNDTGRGAKFNKNTNTISVALNLLKSGFNIVDFVQMLTHEGLHAKLAKPDATITTQLTTSRTNLETYYNAVPATDTTHHGLVPDDNMIQHEYMSEYDVDKAASIIKAFYNSGIGKTKNDTSITDDDFRAFFRGNLVQVEHPTKSILIYMYITKINTLSLTDLQTFSQGFSKVRDSYK